MLSIVLVNFFNCTESAHSFFWLSADPSVFCWGQLHLLQHAQDALHTPPSEMQVDGADEPQEIQGVSEIDFEEQAPQPAQVQTHSPAESEASVNI